MIFRAVFWIGLVSLLTPHEPDLGLGRPGTGTSPLSPSTFLPAASGLSRPGKDCGAACAGGLGQGGLGPLSFLAFRSNDNVTAGLADVRAQIADDKRARAARQQSLQHTL